LGEIAVNVSWSFLFGGRQPRIFGGQWRLPIAVLPRARAPDRRAERKNPIPKEKKKTIPSARKFFSQRTPFDEKECAQPKKKNKTPKKPANN
jgi:hypothetical protein